MVCKRELRRLNRALLNMLDHYHEDYNLFVDDNIKAAGVRCVQSLTEIKALTLLTQKEILSIRSKINRKGKIRREENKRIAKRIAERKENIEKPKVNQTTHAIDGRLIIY